MPDVSATVDALAAEFGAVFVDYASEGGLVWGAPPADRYAVPLSDMESYAVHQVAKETRIGARLERRKR